MVQEETYLQRRIKKEIKTRVGYANKNHGSMISEKGIPDIIACYKGFYLAIEAKEEGNTPTPQQGIHLRNIQKAGGITAVVWTLEEAKKVLDILDEYKILREPLQQTILQEIRNNNISTGEEW